VVTGMMRLKKNYVRVSNGVFGLVVSRNLYSLICKINGVFQVRGRVLQKSFITALSGKS